MNKPKRKNPRRKKKDLEFATIANNMYNVMSGSKIRCFEAMEILEVLVIYTLIRAIGPRYDLIDILDQFHEHCESVIRAELEDLADVTRESIH